MTQETTNFYLYWQRLRKSVLDLQLLGMAKFLVKIVVLFVLFCWEKQQERYCFLRTANSKPKAFFFFACQTSLDPVKNPHSHVNDYKHFFHSYLIISLFFFFVFFFFTVEQKRAFYKMCLELYYQHLRTGKAFYVGYLSLNFTKDWDQSSKTMWATL